MYKYGESVLKIKNLSLSFGKKLILRDINLDIKDVIGENITGQVITLLGVSGIGKTQLMKIIAGLQSPTSGTVLVGLDKQPPVPGKVGMVLQSYPLFEHRTIISNLTLVSKDIDRINYLLEYFEVSAHKTKYPCQLSGGQRQRIAIVQQILSSDKFILLDEPFSGLDPLAIRKLSDTIRKLADLSDENTIILSSHILTPALAVSDHAIMLGKQLDIEGATIINQYSLLDMGLAYNPEIRKNPNFINLVNEINDQFK